LYNTVHLVVNDVEVKKLLDPCRLINHFFLKKIACQTEEKMAGWKCSKIHTSKPNCAKLD